MLTSKIKELIDQLDEECKKERVVISMTAFDGEGEAKLLQTNQKLGVGIGGSGMREIEVTGVSYVPRANEYYIHLANEQKIRVNREEYTKMKRRLSGKSKVFMNVKEESQC